MNIPTFLFYFILFLFFFLRKHSCKYSQKFRCLVHCLVSQRWCRSLWYLHRPGLLAGPGKGGRRGGCFQVHVAHEELSHQHDSELGG